MGFLRKHVLALHSLSLCALSIHAQRDMVVDYGFTGLATCGDAHVLRDKEKTWRRNLRASWDYSRIALMLLRARVVVCAS